MRSIVILTGLTLFYSGFATAGTDKPAALAKSEHCLKCHGADGIALSGMGADALETKIKSIRAGKIKHPGNFDQFTDQDIAEIAKILNSTE